MTEQEVRATVPTASATAAGAPPASAARSFVDSRTAVVVSNDAVRIGGPVSIQPGRCRGRQARGRGSRSRVSSCSWWASPGDHAASGSVGVSGLEAALVRRRWARPHSPVGFCLFTVTHMVIDISRRTRRQYRRATAFVLALAAVATGVSGGGRNTVAAQMPNPVRAAHDGRDSAARRERHDRRRSVRFRRPPGRPGVDMRGARGTGRFTLDVSVSEAAPMYAEVSPERIKQQLLESVRPGTADAVIPEVGEAAVFKPDSPAYAGATAFIKGRILQVHLDGVYARDKKDQVIELLKLAATRLCSCSVIRNADIFRAGHPLHSQRVLAASDSRCLAASRLALTYSR